MTTITALPAAFTQNPHEAFQLLREQGPVVHTKICGGARSGLSPDTPKLGH